MAASTLSSRSVSFSKKFEIEFSGGNILPPALCISDVDNDNNNELVVGKTNGELYIFKDINSEIWKCCSGLGMITCIGIGDIFHEGKNILVTVSGEGWCNCFQVDATVQEKSLTPLCKQRISANAKVIVIGDIDGDGRSEMVVGQTDRIVNAYRWQYSSKEKKDGCFKLLQKWELPKQIGSLSINPTSSGDLRLIVSQPGCNYVELLCAWCRKPSSTNQSNDSRRNDDDIQMILHPIDITKACNPNVPTEIVGNISENDKETKKYALTTLDGHIILMSDDSISWSLEVDNQISALTKLDVTNDGNDEIVTCACNGETLIINHSKQMVRFGFSSKVSAFCAGLYSGSEGQKRPCFVYVTFNNCLHVYYDVSLPRIQSSSLLETLDLSKVTQELQTKELSERDMRELIKWKIYGEKFT